MTENLLVGSGSALGSKIMLLLCEVLFPLKVHVCSLGVLLDPALLLGVPSVGSGQQCIFPDSASIPIATFLGKER